MTMKFEGTLSQLKDILRSEQIIGSWHDQPHGVCMLRCGDGANLHWATGKKTVWFSGKPEARQILEATVGKALWQISTLNAILYADDDEEDDLDLD